MKGKRNVLKVKLLWRNFQAVHIIGLEDRFFRRERNREIDRSRAKRSNSHSSSSRSGLPLVGHQIGGETLSASLRPPVNPRPHSLSLSLSLFLAVYLSICYRPQPRGWQEQSFLTTATLNLPLDWSLEPVDLEFGEKERRKG